MNIFKLIPQKYLPGVIKGAVKAYSPKAKGNGGGALPNYIVPSVQARWLGASISWYTPQMIEYIYRMAIAGDMQSPWEMFDMMESTWPELAKCENQLKDAVCSMLSQDSPGEPQIKIKPFALQGQDPSPEALRRAALADEALRSMRPRPNCDECGLEDTLRDIMDARFKGIAVQEIDWEPRELSTGMALAPRATRWVHPSWYGYPFGPGNERIMLKLGGITMDNEWQSPSGVQLPGALKKPLPYGGNLPPIQSPMNFYGASEFADFPDHKFIINVCKMKSGHPLGSGLLFNLAWYWAAKNFSDEWFLNFAQIFGQPFRMATYDPEMDETDQAKLTGILKAMGSSSYGAFPEGTTLSLIETKMSAGDNPQKAMIDMANHACTQLILRQSLTSDVGDKGGGSKALGTVHNEVLDDVKIACGRWGCKGLNQLLRSIIILNCGDDSEMPCADVVVPNEDDSKETSETLNNLALAGLEPDDDAIAPLGKKLGFNIRRKIAAAPPDPEDGAAGPSVTARLSLAPPHPSDIVAAHHTPALAGALANRYAPIAEIIRLSSSREEATKNVKAFIARQNLDDATGQLIAAAMQAAAEKAAE